MQPKKAAQIVSGFGYAISIRRRPAIRSEPQTEPAPHSSPLSLSLLLCTATGAGCLWLLIINFILLYFIALFSGSCRGVSSPISTAFSDSRRLCNLHDMLHMYMCVSVCVCVGGELIKLSQSACTARIRPTGCNLLRNTQRCSGNCFASIIIYELQVLLLPTATDPSLTLATLHCLHCLQDYLP